MSSKRVKSSKIDSKQSNTPDSEPERNLSEIVNPIQSLPSKTEVTVLPVLKPITETIVFKNEREFNEYYNLHKDVIDQLNTNKLNKMFLIPEFRITKIKGVLSLKLLTPSRVNHSVKLSDQETRITELEAKINQIIEVLSEQFDLPIEHN
jgi:F0F1-type ATP synthase gamma subunit